MRTSSVAHNGCGSNCRFQPSAARFSLTAAAPSAVRLSGSISRRDLAVVKVEEKNLPAVGFGDSEELRTGQVVLAFGSPLGLHNSVSLGVVSAVARQLETRVADDLTHRPTPDQPRQQRRSPWSICAASSWESTA